MMKSLCKPRDLDLLAVPGQPPMIYTYNPATDDYEEQELRPARSAHIGAIGQQWADEIEAKYLRACAHDREWFKFWAAVIGIVAFAFASIWLRDALVLGVGG